MESAVANFNWNLVKICRVCLVDTHNMNDLGGMAVVADVQWALRDLLLAFSKISSDKEMPSLICTECTNQLINAYNFKLKCEESDKILSSYLTADSMKSSPKPLICHDTYDEASHDPIDIDVGPDVKLEVNLSSGMEYTEEPVEGEADQWSEPSLVDEKEKISKTNISSSDQIIRDSSNKYRCDICLNSYNHKKGLIRHMNKVHGTNISNRCKICKKVFSKSIYLEAHMKNHNHSYYNSTPPTKCDLCDEVFESKNLEQAHKQMHFKVKPKSKRTERKRRNSSEIWKVDASLCLPHGEKVIQCKICSATFTKIATLKEHLQCHSSVDIFDSTQRTGAALLEDKPNLTHYSICTKVGNELSISDSETESDSDEVPISQLKTTLYRCEICTKGFFRRFRILCHQVFDHSEAEMPYKCEKCPWKFVSSKLLNDHLRSTCANELKLLSCDRCPMKFVWAENLAIHKNARHRYITCPKGKVDTTTEKKFACGECDKVFNRSEHLRRHKRIHLPVDLRKFECEICHKRFHRRDNLRTHMRVHQKGPRAPRAAQSSDRAVGDDKSDTEYRHLCVYCGRSFTNSSNLIVHMRRHTGEKPYKCDLCDKGFPRSSDLSCHRRTHTGEKPHLCTVCGKGFSRSNKLIRHLRVHTGVRPYKCTYCERAFTQSNDLTLHIRRHTGDKPYVCGICGERFIQGTALQTHRRMKGHFEGPDTNAPFGSMSINNPNRYTSQQRVARIGVLTQQPTEPVEIKPVGRAGNSRNTNDQNSDDNEISTEKIENSNRGNISDDNLISIVPPQIRIDSFLPLTGFFSAEWQRRMNQY